MKESLGVIIIFLITCFFNLLLGYGFKKTDMIDLYNQYDEKKDDKEVLSKIVSKNFTHMGLIGIITMVLLGSLGWIFSFDSIVYIAVSYISIITFYIGKLLLEQKRARKERLEKLDIMRKEYYNRENKKE